MIKFKHIVFAFFFWILIFSCEDKTGAALKSDELAINTISKQENNYTEISEMKDQLNFLSLKQASEIFGTPQECEIIKINENEIPFNLEELLKEHYPNKEYIARNVEITEASWRINEQSWIQVWYKFASNEWMPIKILATI